MKKLEVLLTLLFLVLTVVVVIFISFQFGRIKGHKEAKFYIETGQLPESSPIRQIWKY